MRSNVCGSAPDSVRGNVGGGADSAIPPFNKLPCLSLFTLSLMGHWLPTTGPPLQETVALMAPAGKGPVFALSTPCRASFQSFTTARAALWGQGGGGGCLKNMS